MYSTYLHEKEDISQKHFSRCFTGFLFVRIKVFNCKECTKVYEFRLDSCSAFSVVALANPVI